jgi:hypothetical protein
MNLFVQKAKEGDSAFTRNYLIGLFGGYYVGHANTVPPEDRQHRSSLIHGMR